MDGKRQEKEEASEIFKRYWRRCTSNETYLRLKQDWIKAKEYQKVAPLTAKAHCQSIALLSDTFSVADAE